MPTFWTKPVTVEAMRLTLLNTEEVEEFIGGDAGHAPGGLVFAGPDGPIHLGIGWWVIRNAGGQFASCSPSTFERLYEER